MWTNAPTAVESPHQIQNMRQTDNIIKYNINACIKRKTNVLLLKGTWMNLVLMYFGESLPLLTTASAGSSTLSTASLCLPSFVFRLFSPCGLMSEFRLLHAAPQDYYYYLSFLLSSVHLNASVSPSISWRSTKGDPTRKTPPRSSRAKCVHSSKIIFHCPPLQSGCPVEQ